MSSGQALPGPGENDALHRRIAELEAKISELSAAGERVDSRLPAREALLTEVEKIVHLGSWFLNPVTNEVKWSEELFRILGFDPAVDTASVEKFFQVLHPEDLENALGNMQRLVQLGEMFPTDLRIVWPDGSVRETRTNGAIIRGMDGQVDRVVGTVMDVTDMRRAERERKGLETQLRQAQKMEVVGRLAGGVAHDFNNLLTIIAGNADLLLEQMRDEKVQHIRDAAEVGATLTRQLLAFSRQAVVKPEALDLNALVRDMVRILGRLLGEDIKIRLELLAEPIYIMADRGQVQQILLNLAVNARDAMANGGNLTFATDQSFGPPAMGEITGDGHGSTFSKRWVELSVQDTGIGMDAATRERAFEPFFTTKEAGKGTGLGLSTVQDIVAQTAGTIHIASQPGAGTKVTVRFPRHVEPLPATLPAPAGEARKNEEAILLVEDNPDLRELVSNFLESAGYRVQVAGRPGEAEALWASAGGKFDLLITDMVLPGKSGVELAKELAGRHSGLKTLFISGYSPHKSGLANSAFLQKPFTRAELLMAVDRLLEGAFSGPTGIAGSQVRKENFRPKLVPFPKPPPQS